MAKQLAVTLCITLAAACGSVSGSSGGTTNMDGGSGGDGGTGRDGGVTDGGTGRDGGATDGGKPSECDGLMPGAPGAPSQFALANLDLTEWAGGTCYPAETDGTGHIAVSWQKGSLELTSLFFFIDPASATVVGSYGVYSMYPLIGQASGFIGGVCNGARCSENYVVLDPSGRQLYESPTNGTGDNENVNDPTGGMVHVRYSVAAAGVTTIYLDAIDAAGNIRWTQAVPDMFASTDSFGIQVGVDRQGNVLAIWMSERRYGAKTWAGQWFNHAGTAGQVFHALTGVFPERFYERTGSGLFLAGFTGPNQRAWLGQFDAKATSMLQPPEWLASRPNATLHMVHDGKGYAMLPMPGTTGACEQRVEVIGAGGTKCGSSTFDMGGSCTTNSIIVGYDGTVVQQGPRERETCTHIGHECTCSYRYWPGFFR
ncbi:MAG TPA: hypothetical protein VN874_07290 [Myxococcales bacterium]|nr:hypothetical protein [Myxococcales bacterium]